ncbi:MAG: peptidylprolyl isomerase [Candidatus Sericytochromatia bacterium]
MSLSKLLPTALIALVAVATPALAMGERPSEAPGAAPAASSSGASSIAEMEGAAGHVLVLGPRLTFETAKGRFTVVTFPKEAPQAVSQLVALAEAGFYDGVAFHRLVPNFVIQAGDPLSKTNPVTDPKVGKGGSGKALPAEFLGQTVKHLVGTVGMARGRDANSADSQFYVTLAPTPHLDTNYTIWGHVISGMDVVRTLALGDKITRVTVTGKPAPAATPAP